MTTAAYRRKPTARRPLETYLSDIDHTPLLTADQEKDLARRIAEGDPAARDQMIRANLRLVVNVARRYAGGGVPLDDLIAEGNLGLLRAVEGFDPDAGTRFATYAAWWIRQSIRSAVRKSGRVVRLPNYVCDLVVVWRRTEVALARELDRTPTADEVAGRLGLPPRKARAVQRALQVLDAGRAGGGSGDDGPPPVEQVADHRGDGPGERASEADALGRALAGLERLGGRPAAVLRLRYGLDGEPPRTLQEVGEILGCTRERVRQIERDALAELRRGMDAE